VLDIALTRSSSAAWLPFLLSRAAAVEVLLDEGGYRVDHQAVALRRFRVAKRLEDVPHLRPLEHVRHNHHRLVEGATSS
jgi:hypothetical protein